MEQTVLRPKPMPGQGPAESETTEPGVRRPHAAPRRRGRRLTTLLCALLAGAVLVLSGVGLGTLGATVIGMSRLAELQKQVRPGAPPSPATSAHPGSSTPPSVTPSPAVVATLGVEAVDDRRGAQVVGVHVPGPGYSAGLVRGDVLLAFGRTRLDSAADLARAVARSRPGDRVTLTVRHRGGGHQQLTVVPGVVT
ncbi:PDZ domain-containing protein [Streptomyces sp. HUAS 31]|uniref:PDZ domain-containing protein n=1 Tax=Streptomyces TaxID=1883 RepID=UPI002306685E|nr:PDZ domain-containing protein [Streptomyces sp. HUAS 31]WCE00281.1 PDZ domain-containing protein [Streptomyces sp. HUAS 31]